MMQAQTMTVRRSRLRPRRPHSVWCWESISSLGELPGLLTRLTEVLSAKGYPPEDLAAVEAALGEAIANSIQHGHRGDPRKVVRVRYRVDGECLTAEVHDEGPGFDPDDIPRPGTLEGPEGTSGRGLALIRRCMTSMHYNECGNRLLLCKQRSKSNKDESERSGWRREG